MLTLLQLSYENAIRENGLIAFTREVRGEKNDNQGKYSITSKRLEGLFSSTVWKSIPKPGGHLKFKHVVTGTVIEYKNHDLKGRIDPGAVMTILDNVQETLNILGNKVFNYKSHNWKEKPDYKAAMYRMKK